MNNFKNFISSINSGIYKKEAYTTVKNCKKFLDICKYLKNQGFISGYSQLIQFNKIIVYFKFYENKNIISKIELKLKNRRPLYFKCGKVSRYSWTFLSTSSGILLNSDAYKKGIGGILLLEILL